MGGCNPDGGDMMLGRVQSLVRAFGILDELAKARDLNLGDLARSMDLPRSTAHRLLTTMEALRYVAFDRRTNLWSVGEQAFKVGAAFARAGDAPRHSASIARAVADELGQCVNVSVPKGINICYVEQASVDGAGATVARPGAVLPLHTTAAGKAVLAHYSQSELEVYLQASRLRPQTSKSIVDHAHLRSELELTRVRGFAVDDEEQEEGLRCVATVVMDRLGKPQRALSISNRGPFLDRRRMAELAVPLGAAARRMTAELAS